MTRKGLLGVSTGPNTKHHRQRCFLQLQVAGLLMLMLILLVAMYPVENVRRSNRRMEAELSDLRLDLEAHQEALKISRQKCDAKIKIFQDSEHKYQDTITYYKEAEARLSKEWCQPVTDGVMAEYKKVCQKTIDDYSDRVEKLAKERDMAMKRLDPVAMCCKSATAKNKALLAGMDEETARKKGAQAVAASVRAMEDPNSVISHKQRVSWIPGQKHDKTQEKRDRRHSGKARSDSLGKVFRVAGLGDEKDRLPDMPNTDENKDKSALGAALVEDEADHEAAGAEGGGQSLEEAELHEDEGIAGEQLVEQGIAEALADVVAEEEGDAGDLAADGHIERGEEGAEDVEDGDKIQQEYAEEEEEEVVGVGEDGVDKEDGN